MDQVKEAARAASDFQSHPLLTLINTSHSPTERQGRPSLFSTSTLLIMFYSLSLRPATPSPQPRFDHIHHPATRPRSPRDIISFQHGRQSMWFAVRFVSQLILIAIGSWRSKRRSPRRTSRPRAQLTVSPASDFNDASLYGCARCAGLSPPWTSRNVKPFLISQNIQMRGYESSSRAAEKVCCSGTPWTSG